MDYTTDDFSVTRERNGGARDETECNINYTRSELMGMLHRIDARCKNFGQNIDNTFDIVVLNNKYGYNRK